MGRTSESNSSAHKLQEKLLESLESYHVKRKSCEPKSIFHGQWHGHVVIISLGLGRKRVKRAGKEQLQTESIHPVQVVPE